MERRRLRGVDDEKSSVGWELQQLPEDIIQHILSYLERKDAAKVAVVCKTLYTGWCLHPILKIYHDDENFRKIPIRTPTSYPLIIERVREEFVNHVNKCLERYRSNNQIPQELHLTINGQRYRFLPSSPMIDKLFQKFEEARVGAIRVFYTSCTYFLTDLSGLFQCKALVEFDVEGCRLFGKGIQVRCHLLRRLILSLVRTDDDTIQSIISACPLIENLQLRLCVNLRRIKVVNLACLKEIAIFTDDSCLEEVEVEIPTSLESFVLDSIFGKVRGFKLHHPCQNLKTLSLHRVPIADSFFLDFASKFPNLENFSALYCPGFEEVNISSNSLKSLTLKCYSDHSLKTQPLINAPNLVSFIYKSMEIPCFVSCLSSSMVCNLDIMMPFFPLHRSASFFIQFKETLKALINSKLSLYIRFDGIGNIEEDIEWSSNASESEPRVEVEELTLFKPIHTPSSSIRNSTFVDTLFSICRPKSICLDTFGGFDEKFGKIFCERLMDRRINNVVDKFMRTPPETKTESKFGSSWENDLKGVKIEMINEIDKDAQLVSVEDWKMLGEIRSKVSFFDPLKIFFRLEW